MNRLRLVELFSGIGAQVTALKNVGVPFDTICCCDIDKRAYKAYCAMHGYTDNLGDITKVEHLPPCDLLTYSYPCTSVSMAGKRQGMEEGSGTESSLVWEVGRLLTDMKDRGELPEYLVMENVDAVLNKKNRHVFNKWLSTLDDLGYHSSYAVLNAKEYGIPQNRKRCFMVSSLTHGKFLFPSKVELTRTLGDMLDGHVDDSYYLSAEKIDKYERHRIRNKEAGRGFGWKPSVKSGVMSTIMTNPTKDCTNTVVEGDGKIRYITPNECWRLQGFSDQSFIDACLAVESDNALYKLAGNSIAVPCLESIFRSMFIENSFERDQKDITEW